MLLTKAVISLWRLTNVSQPKLTSSARTGWTLEAHPKVSRLWSLPLRTTWGLWIHCSAVAYPMMLKVSQPLAYWARGKLKNAPWANFKILNSTIRFQQVEFKSTLPWKHAVFWRLAPKLILQTPPSTTRSFWCRTKPLLRHLWARNCHLFSISNSSKVRFQTR